MKVLVSACLLGRNCKYNGGNNFNEELVKLLESYEILPVCPEVLGGLSTPRKPAEIVNGVVRTKDGESYDQQFRKGASQVVDMIKNEKIAFAVLQSRSPSCGVRQVYDGTFTKRLIEGKGILAKELDCLGIRLIDSEEI